MIQPPRSATQPPACLWLLPVNAWWKAEQLMFGLLEGPRNFPGAFGIARLGKTSATCEITKPMHWYLEKAVPRSSTISAQHFHMPPCMKRGQLAALENSNRRAGSSIWMKLDCRHAPSGRWQGRNRRGVLSPDPEVQNVSSAGESIVGHFARADG